MAIKKRTPREVKFEIINGPIRRIEPLQKKVPAWVKKIELQAYQLMVFYTPLVIAHNGHPPEHILMQAVIRNFNKRSIPLIQYYILEDANYHTLNSMFKQTDRFRRTDEAEAFAKYKKYRARGGKTWEI